MGQKDIKNVVVFGAGGRTGRLVVDQLLDRGYNVRAFMHRTHLARDGVEVMIGDINDAAAVDKAIDDMDAVISVVSHGRRSPANMQTMGMGMVNKAMIRNKIARLISLTGNGVTQPGDKIRLIDRLLTVALSFVAHSRLVDGRMHAEYLAQTDLDYTVVRVAKLTNGPATKAWRLTPHGPAMTFISRADTASAIVQLLEDGSYIREMPIISKD